MKYALVVLVGVCLAVALVVSEMALIRYFVRCEVNRFVEVISEKLAWRDGEVEVS